MAEDGKGNKPMQCLSMFVIGKPRELSTEVIANFEMRDGEVLPKDFFSCAEI
jgi:hypothetical protein